MPRPAPVKPKRTFHTSTKEPQAKPAPMEKKPRGSSWLPKILIGLIVILLLAISLLSLAFYWYLASFSQAADISPNQLIQDVRDSLTAVPRSQDGRTNILILGLDEIQGQKENSLLTDTILVASYHHPSKKLTLISLPRDLWIDSLKTKINALYYYGETSGATTGQDLAASIVSEVTGLPIHYHFIIKLDSLEALINSVGGVQIDIPASFTDNKFPRSDVDIHQATSEAELYETVTFEKGLAHMDGLTALKYIRSRQSENEDEGTDIARGSRQQQLIKAIIGSLKQKSVLTDPHILGNLYKIFHQQFVTDLADAQLFALGRINGPQAPQISSLSLPIQEKNQNGLLFHPPTDKHDQWVYEPLDPSWSQIVAFIKDNL